MCNYLPTLFVFTMHLLCLFSNGIALIFPGERVQEVWDYASRELKALGLGTAQVNRDYDPQLARELGIRKLPDFVGVISGKLYHYAGMVTVKNLKDFVKGLFPDNLVPEVGLIFIFKPLPTYGCYTKTNCN